MAACSQRGITPSLGTPLVTGHCPGKEVMTMATSKIGRSAVSGRFTSVKTAESRPRTHVVETIKKPKKG
jgi:hypothetical protein